MATPSTVFRSPAPRPRGHALGETKDLPTQAWDMAPNAVNYLTQKPRNRPGNPIHDPLPKARALSCRNTLPRAFTTISGLRWTES